ncbi:MAG TPA: N-acyl-D-amino-acid deacylase family protein [Candidatus Hypogeohydataceae bacterium YC40]
MEKSFSLIIKNGTVVDGTGSPARQLDLAIKGYKIAFMGKLDDRGTAVPCPCIDATGLIVAPGFIDAHSHSDFLCLIEPKSQSKVLDGVTTEICGNCGSSPFPLSEKTYMRKQEGYKKYELEIDWRDAQGFFNRLKDTPSSINRGFLVGHGSIRDFIISYEARNPTQEELSRMKEELIKALEAGALGLSSGLIYPPGCFASTEELVELCKIVAKKGGVYTTHMRDEGDKLSEAVGEALEIARQSGVSLEISHLKTSGQRNWPKLEAVIRLLEEASSQGIKVSCDRYPYIAAATDLGVLLPRWVQEGGIEKVMERLTHPPTRKKIVQEILEGRRSHSGGNNWDSIVISAVHSPDREELEGKGLGQLATLLGKPPVEVALDLLVEEEGRVWVLLFSMSEENLEKILPLPFVCIGSDSSLRAREGPLSEGKPHPRAYGTFSRILGRYVREKGILSIEGAIHKMTGQPAQKFGLNTRGLLKEDYFADVTIFNPGKVIDRATFLQPHEYSAGIEYVFVNGRLTVDKGHHTGATCGAVLKH